MELAGSADFVQWIALMPHSKNALGSIPSLDLGV